MDEPEIRIEHRGTLAYLLAEAAEIEHGLMCCYLYAAFSIGERAQREQPPERAAAMKRWRAAILDVARDEMVHLALVSNLTNAIGVSPHLKRFNFPVPPGYHPAGVVLSLAPFDLATMDHFVYLERPEGVDLADGAGFSRLGNYVRQAKAGRIVPSAQDYLTVGHLYRGIRNGLAELCAQVGEAKMFTGDPRLQVGPPLLSMDGLSVITDLASAEAALDTILAQGEGTEEAHERAHYCRFVAIRDELRGMLEDDPTFAPARGVARNPVMRFPIDPTALTWVNREPAASVIDVGNATYLLMLLGLDMLFSPAALDPNMRSLALDTALTAMMALTPVGELLTDLPANDSLPGVSAGLSFTMSRGLQGQPDPRGALRANHELARAIAEGLRRHAVPIDGALAATAARVDALGDRLDRAHSAATVPPPAPVSMASSAVTVSSSAASGAASCGGHGKTAASAAPSPAIEEAPGKKLLLKFEGKRCIHSRHCVLGAPTVFLANVKGPWLHPDSIPVEDLVEVAHACPSGAITYERRDGGPEESAPPVNVLRIRENGPYAVHAAIELEGQGAMFRATLCRCGASNNKPYCDGAHNGAGFVASGEPKTIDSEPLAERGGTLTVSPQPNGPLRIAGPLEMCTGTGRTVNRITGAALCRCGGSANKPFCDGTHARNGFRAP